MAANDREQSMCIRFIYMCVCVSLGVEPACFAAAGQDSRQLNQLRTAAHSYLSNYRHMTGISNFGLEETEIKYIESRQRWR